MPPNEKKNILNIEYKSSPHTRHNKSKKSLEVLGLDTETLITGKCFMIATSKKDVFTLDQFPECFMNRTYQNCNFVVWNIKFDEGSLLQNLPRDILSILWKTGKCEYEGYKYHSIKSKMLRVTKNNRGFTIYDVAQFYSMSLDNASKKFLGNKKIEIETKEFTSEYIKENYDNISEYCIKDAVLTKKLADLMIEKFENLEVYPKKLYSTAYISWQHFRNQCEIPTINRFWDRHKGLIDYALQSYNGGKFEVTEKGTGYFYEYDIVSAYPYEIANLLDITFARCEHSKEYIKDAIYGFLKCTIKIPAHIYSPVAIQTQGVNIYPVGIIQKCITKNEYDYLISVGCDITIKDAYWLRVANQTFPFKNEVNRLVALKAQYKIENKPVDYKLVKIILNSLYGKFIQLIPRGKKYMAGQSFNPIYASVITANCRIRVSEYQQKYPQVIAVHTDSVISNEKVEHDLIEQLGSMSYETEGKGVILGSGIYQIGDKTRMRGFSYDTSLFSVLEKREKHLSIMKKRPCSWREVVFHNWSLDRINRFEDTEKAININFDRKRIWIDDYKDFSEILDRNIFSIAYPHFSL